MFQENEKEWILEAINHLKHRKARPDLSRISLRMKRKHQMSFAQTKKLLESLIECGIVVKAVYKNNTSYRDVSQWKKGRLGGQILNSNKMLKRFIRAIEATETSKGTGVSSKEIEDYLASQGEEKCFLSGAALRDALENEIINGYLNKFSVGTQFHYAINTENINSALDIESQDDEVEEKLGGMENSSHHEDSSLVSENLDAEPLLANVMKAINETEQSEGSGSSLLDIKEYLLIKGHAFTDDSFLLAFLERNSRTDVLKKVVKDSVVFYSIPEKTQGVDRADSVKCTLTPDDIPRAFGLVSVKEEIESAGDRLLPKVSAPPPHPMSFAPGAFEEYRSLSSAVPLRPPSKRKRIVKDHGPDFETEIPTRMKAKHTEIKESVYPTPTASPASEKSETTIEQSFRMENSRKRRGRPKKPQSPDGEHGQDDNSKQDGRSEQSDNDEDDTSLHSSQSHPDIFSWSAQQVADYFHKKGYVEEAKNMLANDLDGAALGLLRRSDVVGPPLGGLLKVTKLGVALKLFRDIRDLLYQGNVDNYVDPYEERAFLRS